MLDVGEEIMMASLESIMEVGLVVFSTVVVWLSFSTPRLKSTQEIGHDRDHSIRQGDGHELKMPGTKGITSWGGRDRD